MADVPALTKRYTVDEFEAFLALPENADRLFELIDGEIIEKIPTELHNLIALNPILRLAPFVILHKLGRVVHETRYRASPQDRFNDRVPDLSFTSASRLLPISEEGPVPQIPDLCVEIRSPGDYPKLMREKANYYLQSGAQQVWLVFTRKQLVEVLFRDGNYEHYLKGDALSAGDLIPGFSIDVSEIFDVSGL